MDELNKAIAKVIEAYEDLTGEIVGCIVSYPVKGSTDISDYIYYEYNGDIFQNITNEGMKIKKVSIDEE